jgi:7-cyano-7-deazaguanine synthase
MPKKVVVVLSGGMDSATLLYMLQRDYEIKAVSFNYGQRHKKELHYAETLCQLTDTPHAIVNLNSLTPYIQSSALTGDMPIPEGHYTADNMKQTVVPNRNMMMLSIAGAIAVSQQAAGIATGVHAGDHAVYPDCRPEFIVHIETTLKIANQGFIHPDFQVMAPFMYMTKASIAAFGSTYGVPFEHTWSCYNGGAIHCGRCGTCVERAEAFATAEVPDPTEYESPDFWKTAHA